MYAATAKVLRVSSNQLRLSSSSKLSILPLSLQLQVHPHTQQPPARCFRVLARLQAGTRSPLVNPPPAIPRLKSIFPNTIVHRIINAWPTKRSGTARFVLVPAPAPGLAAPPGKPHPAITRLPPPTGMLCYVQILSTPTADTPGGCVMLHFDNRRYLFGRMAEGTQRNMVQRKVSLAKIHDIFLTGRIDWDTTGGLLGMILTLADLKAASTADVEQVNEQRRNKGKKEAKAVVSHLNIHGGKNLVHLLASARRFILRKALPVEPREVRQDPRADAGKEAEPDYEDENIKVWSIPLSTEEPKARTAGHQSPKKRKLSPSSSSETGAEEDSATEEANQNIRQAVVKDMFCSKWNLDTLREMRLADVRLPAKIFVRNDQGHIQPYTGPPASQSPDTKVLVRLPWPASQIEQLPTTQPSKQSMCYIVKGHSRRGKFDVQAANRLGVVKTDFKKLTAGESVVAKDGSTVTPDMVMGDAIKGHGFAVLDIPSADLIDPLIQRPEFANPEVMEGIDVVYWIFSDGVSLDSPGVQQFVNAHPSVKHIVLSSAVCPNVPALESPMSQLIKMNSIDRERFPLPIFDTNPASNVGPELESVVEIGRAGLQYQLAPKPMFLADTAVPVMDTGRPIVELTNRTPEVVRLASAARKSLLNSSFLAEAEEAQRDLPCPEAEIIPLGTGSAMPSKYRNVSATLIRVPGWGSYLFDCGENTLGQIRRAFGYQGADEILKDLRAIYISHAHADHHLGTINIIAHWRQLTSDSKLAIIATPKYQDFVREFHQVQDLAADRLVPVTLRSIGGRPQPGSIGRPQFPADFNAGQPANRRIHSRPSLLALARL